MGGAGGGGFGGFAGLGLFTTGFMGFPANPGTSQSTSQGEINGALLAVLMFQGQTCAEIITY